MTNTAVQPTRISRSFRYARDGVACLALTVVANVCASITWEHYYGHAAATPFGRELKLEVYSARPIVEPQRDEPRRVLNACTSESRIDEFELPEALQLVAFASPIPDGRNRCPSGMVHVEGMHCPILGHFCREFISLERDRCKEYSPESRCVGIPEAKRFCIDEFEYPNRAGTKPFVAVNYRQAAEYCRSGGKRLCSATEWELACEGPNRFPYPNGYVRDSSSCNIDRPNIAANNDAYVNLDTREAEIARVDQREPSGSRPDCVSGYGVHDMVGNVDEWVVNVDGFFTKPPYRSALKGGYWGRVRNRCRPMTTDHNEWHSGYQIGFRCCAEAGSAEST